MPEKRQFKMHPKLLLDVIQKQAGTLAKAVMEGAMNAVDAGATRFDVMVDETSIIMEDDGKGFSSREEVESFFEVFGQPHEEGDAHYGKFRMGRGQIFSYGHNFWRTGTWSMTVDVKTRGLEYLLQKMDKDARGCKILVTLYDPLNRVRMSDLKREVIRGLRYLEIPVFWHQDSKEERISVDRGKETWDYRDDNCLIQFKDSGSLDVYNMGVFVKGFDKWQFGTGGTVVSTRELDVNFARNDILSTCPIWKKVRKIADQRAQEQIKSKPLDDASRQRLAMMLHGEQEGQQTPYHAVAGQRIITDCCGKHITLYSFVDKMRKSTLSAAARGNRIGDRLMQTGLAYVISFETLDRFGVSTLKALRDLICKAGGPMIEIKEEPLNKLAEKLISETTIIPDKDLKPRERLWVRLARRFRQGYHQLSGMTREEAKELGYDQVRTFKVGIYEGVNGWTDGRSFIAIERSFLSKLSYSRIGDIAKLGHLILHEYCHTTDSQKISDHDPDFFERFHDNRGMVSDFINEVVNNLERDVKEEMKKTNKYLNALLDKKDAHGITGEAFDELCRCVDAARGNKPLNHDLEKISEKLVAASTIRKKPKKRARKVANIDAFKF